MYHSRETKDDSPNRKVQRAVKRARGKEHKGNAGETGERSKSLESNRKRRSVLSIEDTEQQISRYFDPD